MNLFATLLQYTTPILDASPLPTEGTTILIILLIVLLSISFAVSGAEVAFFSLSYKDINMLKTKQQLAYKRIVALLENPKTLLATLLITNSFVNIAIIIISDLIIGNMMYAGSINNIWLEFGIKVFLVTCLLVLFGEIMPKVMAQQNNIRFAKDVGLIIEAFSYLFSGLAAWLVRNSDMIEKKIDSRNKAITLEELDHAIDITTENAASEKEKNILKGIVKFGNISVKQIMRTRMDVNGIEYKSPFNEVVKKAEELHYSRLPVYKNKLDEVVGILHTKDLLPYLDQPPSFDWHQLLRQPYFVHEQKLIEDLLKEFQQKRIHFAVVVDEFGGTSGIVTLEDIIEEIIGDIKDEFDDDDSDYKKLDDNNYIFEGKSMIHDVCKAMKLATDTFDGVKGQSDSLAGLVLEVAGEIPQPNQVISVGDFDFTVLEVVKNRLKKIKVTIKPLQTD